jgi:glucosyl-dolichyl phosphate glucuronosyltransferase
VNPFTTVTVVIPTRASDRWSSLVRTVASARAQTHRPHEVLVVVDHDTDHYRRVRRDLAGVQVVESDHAPGVTGCRDTGAFHATGSLIAFLGVDVVADPQWLSRLVRSFDDPAVVGAGGGISPQWPDGRPRWLPDELLWTARGAYDLRTRTTGMVVRRTTFREVGGFGLRDTELRTRMSALDGGRWRTVPDAVIRHEVPAVDATFGAFLRRCYTEGRARRTVVRSTAGLILRHLRAAVRDRDTDRALRAGGLVAAVAAAGAGTAASFLRPASAPVPLLAATGR